MLRGFLLLCFLISIFAVVYCEEQWQIEEKEVLQTAQRENLPVVAVFVGGKWCPWSEKLRQDVLQNPYFRSGRVGSHRLALAARGPA